jgi:P4 family phage/plasmid primase-like protien
MERAGQRFYDGLFEKNLDSNPNLIGFDNGVYDLVQGYFREGTPDDMISYTTGYSFINFNGDEKVFDEINDYFSKVQPEEDMRNYVLRFIASLLDGNNKDQKFSIWTGKGSNGKSTTVTLIQKTVGENYYGILPKEFLTRRRGSSSNASPELDASKGKRVLFLQEPEHNDEIKVGIMKEVSGGDMLYARPLFCEPFMFKPQFKLVLCCNKLPTIPSTDGGTWRRLRVAPWKSEFTDGEIKKKNQFKLDTTLDGRMGTWKEAFMWLLITKYYPEYKRIGLSEPEEVMEVTKDYKKDSDIFFEFTNDLVDITKNEEDKVTTLDLYRMFKEWYKENSDSNNIYRKREVEKYFVDVVGLKMLGKTLIGLKLKVEEVKS